MQTQQSRLVEKLSMDALIGSSFGGTEKMSLFKSTFTPTQASVLADFTGNVVAFTGYAAQTLSAAWLDGIDQAGNALAIYDGLATFEQSGVVATDIAGGWYITDSGATALIFYGVFDTPVNFDTTGNKLLVKPRLYFPIYTDADAEVIEGP